jgi:hypothetical protein
MTGNTEVVPGQKSASGKHEAHDLVGALISAKSVSELPIIRQSRSIHRGLPHRIIIARTDYCSLGHEARPYEIVPPADATRMGEVYRPRDTRLNRDASI